MTSTLLFTITIEGMVVIGYCTWHRKPILPILVTGLCANLITQFLLWGILNLFFRHYLVALAIAEVLIWMIEGFLLFLVPANRLRLNEALLLTWG